MDDRSIYHQVLHSLSDYSALCNRSLFYTAQPRPHVARASSSDRKGKGVRCPSRNPLCRPLLTTPFLQLPSLHRYGDHQDERVSAAQVWAHRSSRHFCSPKSRIKPHSHRILRVRERWFTVSATAYMVRSKIATRSCLPPSIAVLPHTCAWTMQGEATHMRPRECRVDAHRHRQCVDTPC